jgi:hypothetical protein
MKGYFMGDFGIAYTQATVVNAKSGFVGFDVFAGTMLTDKLGIGLFTGYDVTSYEKQGDATESLAFIPVLVKLKYYFNIGTRLQLFVSGAAGAYRSIPHLATEPIGDIWYAGNHYGGSVSFGINWWFLLTQGVGFDYEYHFFTTEGDMFSYFAVRIDYCLIRF